MWVLGRAFQLNLNNFLTKQELREHYAIDLHLQSYQRAMARLARIAVPEVAHHVTQRGNRRPPVFFSDDDRALYPDLIAQARMTTGRPLADPAWIADAERRMARTIAPQKPRLKPRRGSLI